MPLCVLLEVSVSVAVSLGCGNSECRNLCSVVHIAGIADLRVLSDVADKYNFVYHNMSCVYFCSKNFARYG